MALRKKAKAPNHLLHYGGKTVAQVATAHLEDVQAAKVLGLWGPFTALIHDLEYDAKSCDGYSVSRLGLDLTNPVDLETHHHAMAFFREYLDRQRALELFGALRPEIQTFIENSESGKKLLGSCLNTALTWDEVRTLATEFETRQKTRDADTARQLKKLGMSRQARLTLTVSATCSPSCAARSTPKLVRRCRKSGLPILTTASWAWCSGWRVGPL
jgi:hypothetical protein